jgi:hypothetical protein
MKGPIRPTNRRRLPGREAYVVTALRRKLAELKGCAAHGDNEAPAAIEHVAATLRLFNPAEDLNAVGAVGPYRAARQRWMVTALDIMRRAERPLTGREIARMVMEARRIDPRDRRQLKSIECGLHAVLERLDGNGIVRVEGKPKRWRIKV